MSRTTRLGAFLIGTFAILVLGVFIIGSKKYLFTPTYTLRTMFANVAGLTAGADVRVGGVHVGTVRSIDLPRKVGDNVTVSMDIDTATHAIIKKDSAASIETEGLLGNQYVAISFGSSGQPDVANGDTIPSLPPLELTALFNKANTLLNTGNVAMENIAHATANIQSVTGKIDSGTGTVGALVNDRDIYNSLKSTAANAQDVAASAKTGTVAFQENMEALKHNFLLRGYFKSRGYEDASDIGKDEITNLPSATAIKEFSFDAKSVFASQNSAEIKNHDALKSAGESLASSSFGMAVVVVAAGPYGDSDSGFVLAQARAMVIRDYLVDHYAFDDSKLKTLALKKQDAAGAKGWGGVRIMLYPPDTPVPAEKAPANPTANANPAAKGSESTGHGSAATPQ